jgi:hypothetical protein
VGRDGKKLLRIKITAEVDGVLRDYTITFGRCGKRGRGTRLRQRQRARRQRDRRQETRRRSKGHYGQKPRIQKKSDGAIEVECDREHLKGFKRYAELASVIARWLEETSR